MRGYAHSNCKYVRIIEMHDYHESKTVLAINDNREFKGENVLDWLTHVINKLVTDWLVTRYVHDSNTSAYICNRTYKNNHLTIVNLLAKLSSLH